MSTANLSKILVSALAGIGALAGAGLAIADPPPGSDATPPCQCNAGPFNNSHESPFAHREYITGVAPYEVVWSNGKRTTKTLEGATIELSATPGVTAEWLQQYVNEHLARVRAAPPADMGWCPLTVPGATAEVTSTGDGFAVTINSKDRHAAQEILRRAEQLVTH
jgi:hypothetical protein